MQHSKLLSAGEVLDNRWEVLQSIGKGSFAEVYEGNFVTLLLRNYIELISKTKCEQSVLIVVLSDDVLLQGGIYLLGSMSL